MTARGKLFNRQPGAGLAVIVASLGVVWATPSVAARHRSAATGTAAPAAAASQLVQKGVMALATRDFVTAYGALSAAYRLQPGPDTLYQLGVTALSAGDAVGAQDLMRRYLAQVGPAGDAARHAEAQRIAERPRAKSGEVSVVGPPGAFVLVDERLVGQLPLLRPLLVAVGGHVLALEHAGTVTPGRIEVKEEKGLEARLGTDGTTLQVRQLPTVFVASVPAIQERPQAVINQALTAAGLSIHDAAAHGGALPPPECAQDRACLLRWAAAQGVEYTLELMTGGEPCEVSVRLLDVAIAQAASQRVAACAGEGGVERALAELLPALLSQGLERPRGTLRLTSQPPGAEVMLGSRVLGKTPLTQPSFAEPLELSVQLPGFRPEVRRVEVTTQAATDVLVELVALPPAVPRSVLVWQRHRPRWRIALGITALGVGVGLLGAGIPALAIDGSCVSDPVAPVLACERRYATSGIGIGLVVPGAVLLGTGLITLLIPGARRQVEVATGGLTTESKK